MTNGLSIGLGAVILASIAADLILFDLDGSIFLARKGVNLIEYFTFWR